MKIVKELGSGAFGRIYQLAATCDGTKDHFVSMKFMASQLTESVAESTNSQILRIFIDSVTAFRSND